MRTQTPKSSAEDITALASGLDERRSEIAAILLTHQQQARIDLQNAEEECASKIAMALAADDSEAGMDMKRLLQAAPSYECTDLTKESWGWKHSAPVTSERDPFDSLLNARLLATYVPPSSLWADVDTYDTDPTYYILTELGRRVVEKLRGPAEKRGEEQTPPHKVVDDGIMVYGPVGKGAGQ